jgi:hypothetical protein
MLSKWVPDDTGNSLKNAEEILDALLAEPSITQDLRVRLLQVDIKEYAHLTQVWRYNSFGHHTESNALCMYDITSMMAHSCGATGV